MEDTAISVLEDKPVCSNQDVQKYEKQTQTEITLQDKMKIDSEPPKIEPKSNGETQLYAVLKKANLLDYFHIFVSQGGDDVQQLCEAGKEEFLEIVSLVGMSRKPLHVLRLQKTLQEWVTNPAIVADYHYKFSDYSIEQKVGNVVSKVSAQPCSLNSCSETLTSAVDGNCNSSMGHVLNLSMNHHNSSSAPFDLSISSATHSYSDLIRATESFPSPTLSEDSSSISMIDHHSPPMLQMAGGVTTGSLAPFIGKEDEMIKPSKSKRCKYLKRALSVDVEQQNDGVFVVTGNEEASSDGSDAMSSPLSITSDSEYMLTEEELSQIKETARKLVEADQEARKHRQESDEKIYANLANKINKKLFKEINAAMQINESDNGRETVFRKHSAIYGRFDSKRKSGRKLSPHESAINEAAAQICLLEKSFLVRRDELFMMCRQVLKEIGFQGRKEIRYPAAKRSKTAKSQSSTATIANQMSNSFQTCTSNPTAQNQITLFDNMPSVSSEMPKNLAHAQREMNQVASTVDFKFEETNFNDAQKAQFESTFNTILNSSLGQMAQVPNSMFAPLFSQGVSATAQQMIGSHFQNTLQPINMSNYRTHFWPSGTGNPELNFLQSALGSSTGVNSAQMADPINHKIEPLSP